MAERKKVLLRLDPAVHDAIARWAADELRSANAQIEFLLRRSLSQAGRLPDNAGGLPRRGRPPKADSEQEPENGTVEE
ncbi:type II toxin-antitoxin system antitoxin [Actinophytocola sediminis]